MPGLLMTMLSYLVELLGEDCVNEKESFICIASRYGHFLWVYRIQST
jgi:hypothetical protein